MKLGILNAAGSNPDRYTGRTMPEHFRRMFDAVEAPLELEVYEVTEGEWPRSELDCDAFLVTGSRYGVYDEEPWIVDLGAFIQRCFQSGRKLVGICFGHQMIAHFLGGRAAKSEKGRGLGLRPFGIFAQKPWMEPPAHECRLYFAHQDQVMRLPPGAELLAGNEFCPILMYVIGEQVLALQAHPEIPRELMEGIIQYMGEEQGVDVEKAMAAMDTEPDAELAARWIVNFLLGPK